MHVQLKNPITERLARRIFLNPHELEMHAYAFEKIKFGSL